MLTGALGETKGARAQRVQGTHIDPSGRRTAAAENVRVWIDLANTPHPVLFAPIADELEAQGHEVLVTARDHAQTVALAASSRLSVPSTLAPFDVSGSWMDRGTDGSAP